MFRFTSKPMIIPTLDDDLTSPKKNEKATSTAVTPSPERKLPRSQESVDIVPALCEETYAPPRIDLVSGIPVYDNVLDQDHKGSALKRMEESLHTTASDASMDLDVLLRHAQMRLQQQKSPRSTGGDSIGMEELLRLARMRVNSPPTHKNDDDDDNEEGMINTSVCLDVSECDISHLDDMDFSIAPPTPAAVIESAIVTPLKEEKNQSFLTADDDEDAIQKPFAAEQNEPKIPQSIVEESTQNKMPEQSSFVMRNRGWVIFFCTVAALVREMNSWFLVGDDHQAASTTPANAIHVDIGFAAAQEDMLSVSNNITNAVLGDSIYTVEEILHSNNEWGAWSWGQVILLGVVAKIIFYRTLGKAQGQSKHIVKKEEIHTTAPRASVPIKQEEDDKFIGDFDLSYYENLPVSTLRELLRAKKCNYTGKKDKLVQRLATVYRSELQSLSVVQLRRKMKSKGFQQGGLKKELVQQLVEAGLS